MYRVGELFLGSTESKLHEPGFGAGGRKSRIEWLRQRGPVGRQCRRREQLMSVLYESWNLPTMYHPMLPMRTWYCEIALTS